MIRPPPSSPFFPYTTLSRSLQHRLHFLRVGDKVGREVAAVELHPVHRLEGGLEALRLLDRDHPETVDGMQLDRKSTRLNSSHVRISYAVFCLEQKRPANRRI